MEIHCPSRLHFGLLAVPGQDESDLAAPERPLRSFGGAGLMIESPGFRIDCEPSDSWSTNGPEADRSVAFVEAYRSARGTKAGAPRRLSILAAPPGHAGLGSGTQLGLAVASLLDRAGGKTASVEEMANWMGRGKRSAIGIHGFSQGGFLVEAGKRTPDAISPLLGRLSFPEEWPVLVIIPRGEIGLHGLRETEAFQKLEQCSYRARETDALCRLLLLGVWPAIVERDFDAFAQAIHEYNRRVGERFATVQGGPYAHPGTAHLIEGLRRQGVEGSGQSSWGPAVFAFCEDKDRAAAVVASVNKTSGVTVHATRAANRGAHFARE